ncbi:MAG: heme exporter protein CcmD [Thiotrichales bacterium]|nr:heme exporter protein CcmD [Thiotrichales bacterium]
MTMTESLVDFFRMGGYAFYVWWSYVVVTMVLALNFVLPMLRHRRVRRDLAQELRFADRCDEP